MMTATKRLMICRGWAQRAVAARTTCSETALPRRPAMWHHGNAGLQDLALLTEDLTSSPQLCGMNPLWAGSFPLASCQGGAAKGSGGCSPLPVLLIKAPGCWKRPPVLGHLSGARRDEEVAELTRPSSAPPSLLGVPGTQAFSPAWTACPARALAPSGLPGRRRACRS